MSKARSPGSKFHEGNFRKQTSGSKAHAHLFLGVSGAMVGQQFLPEIFGCKLLQASQSFTFSGPNYIVQQQQVASLAQGAVDGGLRLRVPQPEKRMGPQPGGFADDDGWKRMDHGPTLQRVSQSVCDLRHTP